jgi:hypothetical protein
MTEQQAPAAADPVAPANGVMPAGDEPGSGDDLAAVRRALDEERKQRKAFERQVKELSSKQQQVDDAAKSETQKLAEQLTKLSAERDKALADLAARDVREAVVAAADRSGARRPLAVYRLISDDLDLDEAGHPTNVAKLIDSLKKSDPDLFRSAGSADGAARGVAPSAGADMNALLRRAAGRG